MDTAKISPQTLRRLPIYLHYLRSIRDRRETISATALANVFGLGDVQVRKDLGAVSGSGRPKTGYVIEALIPQIEACLGCDRQIKTVLIGAGHLGQALLSYEGFGDYGFDITAAFDADSRVVGNDLSGKPVLAVSELEAFCREQNIHLAILTVPASAAQETADRLISCGVKAIWNFAPVILRVPDGVAVENENLASSLAVLSRHLR